MTSSHTASHTASQNANVPPGHVHAATAESASQSASPPNQKLDRASITGLVLAGGRGSRMGGLDKGMVTFHDETLAARAAHRLGAQVGPLLISANRHLEDYARLGLVISDTVSADGEPRFEGPLAGILSGLRATRTPYLACVPCDCPFFPDDLVTRLSEPFTDSNCMLAIAYAPDPDDASVMRAHPVFALMRTELADSLAQQLAGGERRLMAWCVRHNAVAVTFPNGHAFYNMNTLQARDAAEALSPGPSPRR